MAEQETQSIRHADNRLPKNNREIVFSEEDLQLFCEVSGDNNPLHLSEEYSSRTAYGQRVVYGALGACACLGLIELEKSQRIARITVDFHRPMFLHVNYRTEKTGVGHQQTVRLFDGSVLVLTLVATSEETNNHQPTQSRSEATHFERSQARELTWKDMQPSQEVTGSYKVDGSRLEALRLRWAIGADSTALELLLWGSYFVGMELPGRSALFFRLVFNVLRESVPARLDYVSVISSLNRAVEQVKIQVTIRSSGTELANGHLVAFVRPELPAVDLPLLNKQTQTFGQLKGKVAVVLGASRGLGASLALSLASEDAEVIAVSRSAAASKLSPSDDLQRRIVWESGDCSDYSSIDSLRRKISAKFGKIDYLICNAFPPIPSLRLETNALARIESYISKSVNLALVPMCVLLPLLHESKGCLIVISSSAVEKPVREWPHYVAAKSAVEALSTVATLQYPNVSSLIVRPVRLLTDMTNTPMGRQNAMSPVDFAGQVTRRLQLPLLAGTTEVFQGDTKQTSSVL